LHEPLKIVGEFTVPIKLHKDVTTHLKVVVGTKKQQRRIVCFAVLVCLLGPAARKSS